MRATGPLLSIVVPTLNEARAIGPLLAGLRAIATPHEVVVADGGSADGTPAIAAAAGARVVRTEAGRGTQLRAGAAAARAPLLFFLHADARLGDGAAARLAELAASPPRHACAFRLRIGAPGLRYRLLEAGANLRTRVAALPYGDQGLVVTRREYDRAGGYPAVPLMEDVALVRALRGIARPRLLPEALVVSPRRWEREGVLRRTLTNWALLGRYLAGTPPERLVRRYRPEPPDA